MKRLNRISTLLLAMVVFISAIGHVFFIHYCSMNASGCDVKTSDCCCAEEEESTIEKETSCCFNSLHYLINPFSVRQPEVNNEKINIVAAEFRIPGYSIVKFSSTLVFIAKKNEGKAPPGSFNVQALLATFLI